MALEAFLANLALLDQLENQANLESRVRMERMEKMDPGASRGSLVIRAKLEMLVRWVSRALRGQWECRASLDPEVTLGEREE